MKLTYLISNRTIARKFTFPVNQDFAGQDGRSDLRLGFAFHQFAVVLN
jgi:hypothetical protein